MWTFANRVLSGFSEIVFPSVCICCGLEVTSKKEHLCSFCKEKRFVDANPNNSNCSSDVLLPEPVLIQHAMWQFDKGGMLQDLMHYLKYERMTSIGLELGRLMAIRALRHPLLQQILENKECVLVPVPLHYLKFRKRGFNQAFMLARGINGVTGISICKADWVVRQKNTKTQTGFSIEKRLSNIANAFSVKNQNALMDKIVVIIDDVFTTGATTFELAKTLKNAGSGDILILTAAQA